MLKIVNVSKYYGTNKVLDNINLNIHKNDITAIIGPSGSGKSTLLRSINMLDPPTSGQIFIDGKEITNDSTSLSTLRQKVGMVFQNFNLFNNLTVLENIILAPQKIQKKNKEECITKALKLLDNFGLKDKANNKPYQLSGGQKQRIAIARALAINPSYMLFDEPTSALDPEMVGDVLDVIKDISKQITSVIVSHEMEFVKNVATNIIFMEQGKIIEQGTPDHFFGPKASPRIKNFLSKFHQ